MKKIFIFSAFSLLLLTGCVTRSDSLQVSKVFINDTDFSKIKNMKVGEDCKRIIFGREIGLDNTAKKAACKAGISKIEYQEKTITSFPFYYSECIKVYGE